MPPEISTWVPGVFVAGVGCKHVGLVILLNLSQVSNIWNFMPKWQEFLPGANDLGIARF